MRIELEGKPRVLSTLGRCRHLWLSVSICSIPIGVREPVHVVICGVLVLLCYRVLGAEVSSSSLRIELAILAKTIDRMPVLHDSGVEQILAIWCELGYKCIG